MGWKGNSSRRRSDHPEPAPPIGADDGFDLAVETPLPGGHWYALSREIDRCRRYCHPLSLLRVSPAGPPQPDPAPAGHRREGRPGIRRRDRRADLAAELRLVLRSGDEAWRHGAAVFVLAPETDAVAAQGMVARIRPIAVRVLGTPVDVRVAAFPEDGITGHALRRAIEAREPRFATPRAGARRPGWPALPRLADTGPAPDLPEGAD
jgi:hypothetical protein